MSRRLTATETKAKLLSILNEVEGGEEVEITRHGRTIARLLPAYGPSALRGALAGAAATTATDLELFGTGITWNAQ